MDFIDIKKSLLYGIITSLVLFLISFILGRDYQFIIFILIFGFFMGGLLGLTLSVNTRNKSLNNFLKTYLKIDYNLTKKKILLFIIIIIILILLIRYINSWNYR